MRYRFTGPVEVDAFQWTSSVGWPDWLDAAIQEGWVYYQGGTAPYVTIEMPAGATCRAHLGDWIVREANSVIFALPPEAFAQSYEAVP